MYITGQTLFLLVNLPIFFFFFFTMYQMHRIHYERDFITAGITITRESEDR